MAKIIVVTSGKGGVGKTTTSASFAAGLALRGFKTAVIDFDVGLRNLDLIMGCERRVVYDLINVIHGEANLNQALIQELTPRDRMGRVMALSTMVNAGLLPIGGLLSALVASVIGARHTVSLCGALAAVCVVATWWRSRDLRSLR
mgnify:CR=1 FL=1